MPYGSIQNEDGIKIKITSGFHFEAKGKDERAFNKHRNLLRCLNGFGALFALRINFKDGIKIKITSGFHFEAKGEPKSRIPIIRGRFHRGIYIRWLFRERCGHKDLYLLYVRNLF